MRNIQAVVNCVLPRPKTAEDSGDVNGSPPRMLGLRLLAHPPGIAWTARKVVSDLMTSIA